MVQSNGNKEYYIGVDVGGTKILAGVFTKSLECVETTKVRTKAYRGKTAVIDRIKKCIFDVADEADIDLKYVRAIGIGAPGAVDSENGVIIFAPNLGWENVPLKKELEDLISIPTFIGNDCNVNTLGVYEVELHKKPKILLGIYLGTGIGGGLIIDGRLYTGFSRTACEVGHIVLDINGPRCSCGKNGCFEAFASRKAILNSIVEAVKNGSKTVMTEWLGDNLGEMRSRDLRKALKKGDQLVKKIIKNAAVYTGIAVANLINVLNPQVVVLGGGIIEALEDDMMPTILETVNNNAFPGSLKGVDIIATKLGDFAGINGAAVLAKNCINNSCV